MILKANGTSIANQGGARADIRNFPFKGEITAASNYDLLQVDGSNAGVGTIVNVGSGVVLKTIQRNIAECTITPI